MLQENFHQEYSSDHSQQVIANYAPWSGVYMFHCHNLVHEDHDMMAAFNVTNIDLKAFGYPETVGSFSPYPLLPITPRNP